MSSAGKNLLRASLLGMAVSLSACSHQKKSTVMAPTSAPALDQQWVETPISVPAESQIARPVQEGFAPLVYMVETDQIVRVVDVTTNTDLLTMPVMARSIVTVNPDVGVQISGATMRMGALPRDHRYAIYLQSNQQNIIRRGSIRPGQPGGSPVPSGR
ncbi:MAG TPA: hypothetical protein VHD56_08055 [Tepidisphaeraceae bacterium]|nr:hypothetical protein [Tepidisphaeraceae bacterium]